MHGLEGGTPGRPAFKKEEGGIDQLRQVGGANENGFLVLDGNNTFRKNKAAKTGAFGLRDETGAGTNVYEANKFGTEQIP